MPRTGSPYGAQYQRDRARLLARRPSCHLCGGPWADSANHVPALALHRHVPGSGCCVLKPAHLKCNEHDGRMVALQVIRARARARRAGYRPRPKGTRTWRRRAG